MSRIEDLVSSLCPGGVKTEPLGVVCEFGKGNWIKADLLQPGVFPVVTSSRVVSHFHSEANRPGQNVVVASSGAYAGFVSFWDRPFWLSNAFSVDPRADSELLPKFLFHLLKNLQEKIHDLASTGGVPNIYGNDLESIPIPLPPLEVQREIVRILDTFTELEAELEAELDARKKQYEHYRNQLLIFPEQGGVRWVPMGEVLRIRNGRDHKHLGTGTYPVWGSGGIMRFADEYFYDKPSVLIPRKGSLGNLFYTEEPFWTVDTLFYTEVDQALVAPKFVYRFLQTQDLAGMNEAGGVPSLTQTMLNKILIPLPGLETQQEIVQQLDRMDELLTGTKASLPAEIEARRKQYEHYRNQLLTFKELVA